MQSPPMMDWFNNSKLFEMARSGKRLTHIAAVIPLVIVFAVVSQLGAAPVYVYEQYVHLTAGSYAGPGAPSPTISQLWLTGYLISSFALLYLFVWLWVRFVEKRPFWTLGLPRANALRRYLRGFAIGMLLFSGAVGTLVLLGSAAPVAGNPARQGMAALGGVLIVLIGWIVQGGSEEILLRGWALPVIGARYRPWLGLAISAVLFSILHGLNPGISALALLNLVLFAVFAGLYAMREGSIWGMAALHSAWNWAEGNIFGLDVSGTGTGGVTLIKVAAKGPDLLTGGKFGPEGGLVVSAFLLLGILLVVFWKSRQASPLAAD
jgi:membrane protease YdiL (CAAX protease family)